jgi:two-component system sensor histidine kinase UhpB
MYSNYTKIKPEAEVQRVQLRGYDILVFMVLRDLGATLRSKLNRTSLFQRIVIGNALVIIVGAIAGTLITRHLAIQTSDWKLILGFAVAGILLSIGINFLIVGAALRPLRDLGRLAKRLSTDSNSNLSSTTEDIENADPFTARMANTLRTLFFHLQERNAELRALSERAITAQEAESKAIAQSLHDDTGQALTMLAIHLDRIDERIPDDQELLKKQVAEARLLTASALTELRHILAGLRPSILDDLGLIPAIRWYARTNLETAGVHVIFKSPNTAFELPQAVSTTLFRIAQEAMNNIVRHAQASSATIVLQVNSEKVQLRVEDNGRGFDQEQVSHDAVQANQLGLVGVRERAKLLGGKVTIESNPGKGSYLLAVIPLDNSGEDNIG